MLCPSCQTPLSPNTPACPSCGAAAAGPARLRRIPALGRIGGVCAGLADYLRIDPAVMRGIWLILSVVPGAIVGGVLAYLIAWMLMPVGPPPPPSGIPALRRRRAGRQLAGVCNGLAHYIGVDVTAVRLVWVVLAVLPGAIVGGVAAYAAAWLVMPPDDADQTT